MERKVGLLLVAISAVIVATSAVDNLPKTETDKVAAVASKVVQALEDHPFKADGVAPEQQPAVAGSQDHPKVRIVPRKGVLDVNVTSASTSSTTSTTTSTPIAASVPKATEAQHNNITTTVATPQVSVGNNATVVGPAVANATLSGTNVTALGNATTPGVAVPSASKPTTVTSSTTSTTTTTTTTTSTTTTTKPPKKPKITYSVDDEPKLVQAAKPGYSSAAGSTVSDVNGRLHVEEPLAELSKEYIAPAATLLGDPNRNPGHREYVIPVVTLIFAIPLLAGLFLLSYRRAKEFWLTRHYRRMDFLVDGMYNY